MKTLLSLVLSLLLATAVRAVPELTAIFVIGDDARFVLVNTDADTSSGSLVIGDEFAGYKLLEYDRAADVLVLSRDGIEHRIRLRETTIEDATLVFSGTIQLGVGDGTSTARIALVNDEERAFALTSDVTFFLKASRLENGNIAYTGRFEKKMPDGTKEVLGAPRVTSSPSGGFGIRMGEFGLELKPEA